MQVPENTPDTPGAPAPEIDAIEAERDALAGAIDQAVADELARVPESRRSLVPENLAPADKLVYLLRNRALLLEDDTPAQAAPVFAGEKPLAIRADERPWSDLTYTEKVRLAKERPDQFRRLRETHLRRDVVATR